MARKQVTFYMEQSIYERFQKKYPHITSVFFRRVVNRALLYSAFFQDVFFNTPDSLSESDLDKLKK